MTRHARDPMALTPNENYSHMNLWCMLAAQLLIGCDMQEMSPFIISQFTMHGVLGVEHDSLGEQGWRAKLDGSRSLKEAFGRRPRRCFLTDATMQRMCPSIGWTLTYSAPKTVRDLWGQRDVGVQDSGYHIKAAAHGAELFKLKPVTQLPGGDVKILNPGCQIAPISGGIGKECPSSCQEHIWKFFAFGSTIDCRQITQLDLREADSPFIGGDAH
jgi:hypothetical protein